MWAAASTAAAEQGPAGAGDGLSHSPSHSLPHPERQPLPGWPVQAVMAGTLERSGMTGVSQYFHKRPQLGSISALKVCGFIMPSPAPHRNKVYPQLPPFWVLSPDWMTAAHPVSNTQGPLPRFRAARASVHTTGSYSPRFLRGQERAPGWRPWGGTYEPSPRTTATGWEEPLGQ